jgi:hypothetical protein
MNRRDFIHTAAITPLLLAAGPQGDDLTKKYETLRATDPVAALKFLAQNPGDTARKISRAAIAKQITLDVAAGLKAYADGKGDQAELPFTRAALLADPYGPDLSRQLMRLVFLLKQPRKVPTSCATCKGLGAAPCGACQAGLALGACTRCETKGSVPCLLCDGSGTLDHRGYKGTLLLAIEHTTTVTFKNDKGKTVRAKAEPQTLTYQMSPCSGGNFHLQTENVVTSTGAKKNETANQPCSKFWGEMKMFVFSGKAKIKVNNNKGQLAPLSSQGARRFFGDYEICTAGRVTCDRCAGKKSDTCSVCLGKGKALIACDKCEGSAMIACAACKGYGDALWLASLLPQAPALSRALVDQAGEIKAWTDERQRRSNRLADLTRRLEEAKKGTDPTAKLTTDFVDIVCPRCKGNSTECEDCWGAGRREYYEGTGQYERYAVVERLTRQVADLSKAPAPPPTLAALPESESVAPLVQNPGAKPPSPGPAPALPAGAPPAGMTLPKTVEEMVKKADEFHESGKGHLEKSKAASDNATWIDEGMKALSDFKNAQILYTAAQERLDESGGTVPRALIDKFRTNMQGLVMARKQVP